MKSNEDEYCAAYDVFCKRTGSHLIVCNDGSVGALTKNGWRWLFAGKHSYDCLTILGQSIRSDSDAKMKVALAKKILDAAQTNDVVSMTGTYELCSTIAAKGESLEMILIRNDLNA